MSRSVLLLAYYFAPHQAVASIRTTSLARSLAHAGWRVTVLTVDDALLMRHDDTLLVDTPGSNPIEIVRTDHRLRFLFPAALKTRNEGVRRLVLGTVRAFARRLGYERESGWLGPARKALKNLGTRHFDVVLSSGGPWLSHSLAIGAGRTHRCPVVLDYRDLWCGNPHDRGTSSTWRRRTESNLRAEASAIIAVSPSILAVQQQLFGPHQRAVVITNGYPEHPIARPERRETEGFEMLYSGQFYPPKRTVEPFLRTLRLLLERWPDLPIRLRYMGQSAEHVRQMATAHACTADVVVEERMPRARALQALRCADVALVNALNSEFADPAEASIVTGKIFEIFSERRPYLVVAPRNSDLHPIVETAGGGRIFTSSQVEAMAQYLDEVRQGRPEPYRHPEQFGWRHLGARLDQFLSEVCDLWHEPTGRQAPCAPQNHTS